MARFDAENRLENLHHLYHLVRGPGHDRVVFLPETRNRTLEELDEIFNSPSPVKTSVAKKRLGLDAYGEVVNIQDV